MDIASFYEGDPRRRPSEELEFGDRWRVEADPAASYRIRWVRDTGEVYAVREPHPGGLLAPFLDDRGVDQSDATELTVEILGVLPTQEQVDAALDAWPKQETVEDSLAWARAQVAAAG